MLKSFFLLSLLITFTPAANARDRWGLAAQFSLIPIEKAHQVSGLAYEDTFNPYSIKVFVWNIKKTQERGWKEEFQKFTKESDLILIQEAYKNPLFTGTIHSMPGFQWDMGVSFLYKKDKNTETGTMIGSKVRPNWVKVTHSPDVEPVIFTPKALTFAKYPVQGLGDDLLVITVHAINFTSFADFRRHMEQAREEIRKHNGPVLFSGDFNTWSKRRTDYLFAMVKDLGLENVEFKNGHQRMKFKLTNRYLDWTFVRNLRVKSPEVLGYARGSDHKPMVMEVEVQR